MKMRRCNIYYFVAAIVTYVKLGRANEVEFVLNGSECDIEEKNVTQNEEVWLKIKSTNYHINHIWCHPSYVPGSESTVLNMTDFRPVLKRVWSSKKNIPSRILDDGDWRYKFYILENIPILEHKIVSYNGTNYTEVVCVLKVNIQDEVPVILLELHEVEDIAKCKNEDTFNVVENGEVVVKTVTNKFDVKDVSCTLKDKKQPKDQLLVKKKFEGKCNDQAETCRPTKKRINITSSMGGEWNCAFQVQSIHSTSTPQKIIPINCTFKLNVTSSNEGKQGLSSDAITLIAICSALVVVAVIIAQSMYVCHLKAKAKSEATRRRLGDIPLARIDNSEKKPRVYSTLPWQKQNYKIKKLQEEDTRSTSAIYEDVSPVLPIKNRPPMPLPEVYEDPEKILGGRTAIESEPSAACPPELPDIETLPRVTRPAKHHAKSNRSLAAETPSSIDSQKSPRLPPRSPNTTTSRPRPKVMDDIRKPGASPPIVNELQNVLKKRKEGLVNSSPTTNKLSKLSNFEQSVPPPKPKQGITNHSLASVPSPALNRRNKPKLPAETPKRNPKPGPKPPPLLPKPKPEPSREEGCKPELNVTNRTNAGDNDSDDENEWTYEALSQYNIYNM